MELPKLFTNIKFGVWPGITKKQKITLLVSLFMLFALPVSVFLALGPVNLLPRASSPATTPTIPIATPTPTPKLFITPTSTRTPVPTKIFTPTPTPIRIPTPTPTKTMPTPMPTPRPILNINPAIQTTSLPVAQWLSDYKASVTGYDANVGDTLTMQVVGLPFGLNQASCNTWKTINKSQISCALYGRPYVIGAYKVSVTVKDNKGGTATSVLNLTVRPMPRFALPWTLRR